MYKTQLCLGTMPSLQMDVTEQIRLFHRVGFDGFFVGWDQNLQAYRSLADDLGMLFQSVHAPFKNAAKMWQNGKEAEIATEELLRCVEDCSEARVPILIVHPYIGFQNQPTPTNAGIANFRAVVERAKEKNVRIAFENVEGECYLEALLQAFEQDETVGFCWDSGHELCYNRGKDMTELYGNRLIATHLNDNLGVSDRNGRIYWTDDLHLLPFDGIADWNGIAARLNRCGYEGPLTFELTRQSKPNRHENDKYMRMSAEEYVTECYIRACRLAYLKNGMDR